MKKIRDWKGPYTQLVILVATLAIPSMIDVTSIIRMIFSTNNLNFDNAKYFFLMKLGNGIIGIVFMLIVLFVWIRKSNKSSLLNTGDLYHDHLYVGYWICSKILGYKKCNLIRVPVAMQFKLVIRDTFVDYDYGQDNDYRDIDDENIKIKSPSNNYSSTVNLVLSDTYPVFKEMLPTSTSDLSTIWIQRDNKNDSVRSYSKKFRESVQNTVRQLPNNVCAINLYPTLNPKHSYWIARNVFKLGGRSNIRILTIFSQPNKNGNWNFSETGTVIFTEK